MYYISLTQYEKEKYQPLLSEAHYYIFGSLFFLIMICYFIRFTHKQFSWKVWPSWTLRPITMLPLLIFAFIDALEYNEVQMVYTALIFVAINVLLDIFCMEYEDREKKRDARLKKQQSMGIDILNTKTNFTVKGVEMQNFKENMRMRQSGIFDDDGNQLLQPFHRQRSKAPSFFGLDEVTHILDKELHGDEAEDHDTNEFIPGKRGTKIPGHDEELDNLPRAPSPRETPVKVKIQDSGGDEVEKEETVSDKRFIQMNSLTNEVVPEGLTQVAE